MKKTIILICLFTLLILSGCDDDKTTNDNPEIGVIMKLSVGNTWTYESTRIDTLGNILSIDTIFTHIYRDTVIDNVRWYVTTDEVPMKVNSMLTHRDDGLWTCGPPESMLAKYPANINDTWTDANNYNRYWLKAKGVIAAVPMGTFSTYKYLSIPNDAYSADSTLIYYAPGYGPVKSRFWPETPSREEYRLELIEMALNY